MIIYSGSPRFLFAFAVTLLAAIGFEPTPTRAQPASSGDEAALSGIVVTAENGDQRLQDVGRPVTAIPGQPPLKRAGVHNVMQLGKVARGLSVSRSQFGFPIVSLRGVSTSVPCLSAQPTVSTYVDAALFPYPGTRQGAFLDVKQVKVPKGPQGPLLGQNATGGAINIVAAKPTEHLTAAVGLAANLYGGAHLKGFISGVAVKHHTWSGIARSKPPNSRQVQG